jgi:hypothetical protein
MNSQIVMSTCQNMTTFMRRTEYYYRKYSLCPSNSVILAFEFCQKKTNALNSRGIFKGLREYHLMEAQD